MTLYEVNIFGCGGHARSVINLLEKNKFSIKGIYDVSFDSNNKENISGYELTGKIPTKNLPIILAIGDNKKREQAFLSYHDFVFKDTIFHPSALTENRVTIGKSNLVFAGAVLNAESAIGNNNIINTGAVIEHESVIGNNCHISVGAIICGRVTIGNNCFIGAGSVVIDKVKIGNNVIVGANSVVIRDIKEEGIYVGNPVKKIK